MPSHRRFAGVPEHALALLCDLCGVFEDVDKAQTEGDYGLALVFALLKFFVPAASSGEMLRLMCLYNKSAHKIAFDDSYGLTEEMLTDCAVPKDKPKVPSISHNDTLS